MTPIETSRARVAFLLQQIESLERYLPETYQMLMNELDQQYKQLKHLELKDFYHRQSNAQQDKTIDSDHQEQSQEPIDQST